MDFFLFPAPLIIADQSCLFTHVREASPLSARHPNTPHPASPAALVPAAFRVGAHGEILL